MWSHTDAGAKESIFVDVIIPQNLKVTKAIVKIIHSPCYWTVTDLNTGNISYIWGYSRNVRLYKCTNINSRLISADFGGGVWSEDDNSSYNEIAGAFGINGFTAKVPSSLFYDAEIIDSIDIQNNLDIGLNRIKIESANVIPTNRNSCAAQTRRNSSFS